MSNMKDEVVIKFYVSRFGRPDSKGICYMTQILKQAIAKELTHDTPRYDHLVAKVAKENGVAPASILRSIGQNSRHPHVCECLLFPYQTQVHGEPAFLVTDR